jgi:type II secretory pathway predicted ATPase ExeA
MGRDPASPGEDTVPYLAHFGLRTAPFSLLPDPDFLFWSASHKRAHAMLEYGLMNRSPLTLITGEIGAGKTTLVHHLLRGPGAERRVGLISNASDLRGELLYWVLMALGERPDRGADLATLFAAFQTCLIDTYAAGRRVVLIFDEAQTLGRNRLEALRMLTNINTGTDVLLQIVLVGQPELRAMIRAPDMVQFAQRVAASFHLPAMDAETQARYIEHRLKVAGTDRPVFDAATLSLIHERTGGIPRLTNQICDLAMLYAYSADKLSVDPACVQHVLDEGLLLGTYPACQDEPRLQTDRPATGSA